MLNPLNNKSLGNKILWQYLIIITMTLAAFSASILYFDFKEFEKNERARILSVAMVVAESLSASVFFDDREKAQLLLLNLDKIPDITKAQIIKDKAIFASFDTGSIPKEQDVIEIPITFTEEKAGSLVVHFSSQGFINKFLNHSLSLSVIVIVTLVLSYLLLSRAIAKIIGPVKSLSQLMLYVKNKRDYDVKAEVISEDEIGEMTSFFNDMMERIKKRDQAITKYSTRLEMMVQERTMQLKEAKDNAERANRAKSLFLANMSHEIRTPLNAVIALSEMALRYDEKRFDLKECLQMIRDSAHTLMQLLNDILDYSKIEAGKVELNPSNFDLRSHIDEVLSIFKLQAVEKGITLYSYVEDTIPENLYGDILRLKQVLINLLSNAIKFTDHGLIELKVYMENTAMQRDNIMLHFVVKDTGKGICTDKIGIIFDLFTQEDSSITKRYGGTGLGLNISKKLVELMGGMIWVDSELGKGSAFHFIAYFGQARQEIEPRINANKTPTVANSKLSILIVDDNIMNQKRVLMLIRNRGHHAQVASSVKEALNILKNTTFDLILMDVQMPDIDGIEATRIIRNDKTLLNSNVPIIGFTAHAIEEYKEKCLAAGMNGYLTKPISFDDFVCFIEGIAVSDNSVHSNNGAASSVNSQEELFDSSLINNNFNNDQELIAEVMELFIKLNTQNKIDEIISAAQEGNLELLTLRSHSLKGSAATGGALRLSSVAYEIEQASKAGDIEKARSKLAELQEIYRDTIETIKRLYPSVYN